MQKERAILIALETKDNTEELPELVDELKLLTYSAGADIVEVVVQRGKSPDPAYLIGRGKVEELREISYIKDAKLIIFLNDLKPTQERNLTETLEIKVIDRQALILDIFAQRAKTREGKLQVELAQLNYLLPRLIGYGVILSRLGGGIGTRGPGETKLETDRRHISRKITTLKKQIHKVRKHRELLREGRHSRGYLTCAIVGYTNAGKSTLLNALTKSNVLVEDKLFATLDPTTKKVYLPSGTEVLLIDTVGFIRNLPHELVAAFKATLEEVQCADVIINLLDISSLDWKKQFQVTNEVIEDLAADNKPILNVLNKVDMVQDKHKIDHVKETIPDGVFISALQKQGFSELFKNLQGVIKNLRV